jgi:hypothetical protein
MLIAKQKHPHVLYYNSFFPNGKLISVGTKNPEQAQQDIIIQQNQNFFMKIIILKIRA